VAETIKAAAIAANPFTCLSQLRKRLGEVFPFTLSRELLRVVIIIKKQGLSKKKAKYFSKPTNLEAVTDAFLKKRDQLIAEGRTFVSIDETKHLLGIKNIHAFHSLSFSLWCVITSHPWIDDAW
jgi:hypothetical protein